VCCCTRAGEGADWPAEAGLAIERSGGEGGGALLSALVTTAVTSLVLADALVGAPPPTPLPPPPPRLLALLPSAAATAGDGAGDGGSEFELQSGATPDALRLRPGVMGVPSRVPPSGGWIGWPVRGAGARARTSFPLPLPLPLPSLCCTSCWLLPAT
jgi:hypothetical protein